MAREAVPLVCIQGLVRWRTNDHPYIFLPDVSLIPRLSESLTETEVNHVNLSVRLSEPQYKVVQLDVIMTVSCLMELPQ